MPEIKPSVVIIAGPNGAGKSTAAPFLLQQHIGMSEFVNADVIASGLSFRPETVSLAAGRIMLTRLRELADERANFAFETTLSSRTFAPWLNKLIADGYQFHLAYLWLPNAEFAKRRVKRRVTLGGHTVPERDIERRYGRSLWNLRNLSIPLATTWFVYDSSDGPDLRLIASGAAGTIEVIEDPSAWRAISETIPE